MLEYRRAVEADLPAISAFVDFWLAGRGIADGVIGSAHDYFVPKGRHLKFILKYSTIIALLNGFIIGWSVKSHLGVLIHLLVAGPFRHQGIGSKLLALQKPDLIRSKVDQAAGNPAKFYVKLGFSKLAEPRRGKRKNIELFQPIS